MKGRCVLPAKYRTGGEGPAGAVVGKLGQSAQSGSLSQGQLA